jgi:eukaryotic-like serine/threonine-protein kinase
MAEFQMAWPFTHVIVGELDEFIDRWIGWFAQAAEGTLSHPSTMPEREAQWRR